MGRISLGGNIMAIISLRGQFQWEVSKIYGITLHPAPFLQRCFSSWRFQTQKQSGDGQDKDWGLVVRRQDVDYRVLGCTPTPSSLCRSSGLLPPGEAIKERSHRSLLQGRSHLEGWMIWLNRQQLWESPVCLRNREVLQKYQESQTEGRGQGSIGLMKTCWNQEERQTRFAVIRSQDVTSK